MGIALPDTFGTEAFLGDFDHGFARMFDGVRQDSGNPDEFAERIIAHYKSLGIDPSTKSIVFSDSLNPQIVTHLEYSYKHRIQRAYGMGTHLTNAFPNCKALNIVIKMRECNGIPVVKLSDDKGKNMGDRDALRVANWTFHGTPLDADQ